MNEITKDSINRSKRTLIQGIITTVIVTVCVVGGEAINAMTTEEFMSADAWITIGIFVLKDSLTAVASFVHRELDGRSEK